MRLRLLAWATGAALSAALLAPTTASAATETETIHFSDTFSEPSENPCTGDTGTLTVDFRGVIHTTAKDNGTFHITGTFTGTFTFTPDDPSAPSGTGPFASWFGENVNSKNFTATDTFNVVVHASDGSLVKEHALFHLTVNANGTVTSTIETDEIKCL